MGFLVQWSHPIFLIHLASCFFMTGVIWYIQIVVYPQLRHLPAEHFARFHPVHTRRTGLIVGPAMTLELVSGLFLLLLSRNSSGWPDLSYLIPFGALGLIWLSTAVFQIPLHARLEKRRDDGDIENLNRGNWIRTLLWSFRSLWLLQLLSHWL